MLRCTAPSRPPSPGSLAGAAAALDPALLASPVLIVEDEAMIAWMVETVLEELGFTRIAIASSGEGAIDLARNEPPRLLVSDINLGPQRMDGVTAAATILTTAAAASVVFVTGNATGEARRRIDAAVPGAVLLAKPVGATDLARAIAVACTPGH